MKDYEPLVALSIRLITTYGREVTFVRKSNVPADPTKPWYGPAPGTDIELNLPVIAAPPAQIRQFGLTALSQGTEYVDLITFSEQILIVAQGENDIKLFSHVRDEGILWSITAIQVLRPATKNLLAYVGVRR